MTAYLVVGETITDAATFDAYKRAVLPTIESFGGRFLARGGAMEVLEADAGWAPGRMVIIAFPSMEVLKAWYGSEAYAAIRDLRFRSASSTLVAVEGLEGAP